jgi:hypothetical protein
MSRPRRQGRSHQIPGERSPHPKKPTLGPSSGCPLGMRLELSVIYVAPASPVSVPQLKRSLGGRSHTSTTWIVHRPTAHLVTPLHLPPPDLLLRLKMATPPPLSAPPPLIRPQSPQPPRHTACPSTAIWHHLAPPRHAAHPFAALRRHRAGPTLGKPARACMCRAVVP